MAVVVVVVRQKGEIFLVRNRLTEKVTSASFQFDTVVPDSTFFFFFFFFFLE